MTRTLVNTDKARVEFFEALFADLEGYLCIAFAPPSKRAFEEKFFTWPNEAVNIIGFLKEVQKGNNVWLGAQLYSEKKRAKQNVVSCRSLWADLDTCSPTDIQPVPPVVVRSSDGRFQAYWPLKCAIPGVLAEDYSRRIAYAYKDKGVDTSGWDLTQLLRVPYTQNFKYSSRPLIDLAMITTEGGTLVRIDPKEFEAVPQVVGGGAISYRPPPERILSAETLMAEARVRLPEWIFKAHLRELTPGDDWSGQLWSYMLGLFEHNFTAEEVYAIATDARCNKFARDGNPERLWDDVLRAESYANQNALVVDSNRPLPQVAKKDAIPDLQVGVANAKLPTFVERYIEWACEQTDAPRQYHEAAAFFVLSSLLAGRVTLESSIGTIGLNLWIMILGNTTLTRKTTSMQLALRLVESVDEDVMLATEEGSIEGILDSLSTRPKRPSVFYRDEIAGMLKGMARKDYLAGMLETFTKLYDGNTVKRLLRKLQLTVHDPVFLIFGGGIKDAILANVTSEHVTSGFLPRFLFISGKSDVTKIRPIGVKTVASQDVENMLHAELVRYHATYAGTIQVEAGGQLITVPRHIVAEATEDAWEAFNSFQKELARYASGAHNSDHLLPTFERTAISAMKMATLIAATRQEPSITDRITVEAEDVEHALGYVQKWLPYTIELIDGVGRSAQEQIIEEIHEFVIRNQGVVKSMLMRRFRLTAFDYKIIMETMTARGLLRIERAGRGERVYDTGFRS